MIIFIAKQRVWRSRIWDSYFKGVVDRKCRVSKPIGRIHDRRHLRDITIIFKREKWLRWRRSQMGGKTSPAHSWSTPPFILYKISFYSVFLLLINYYKTVLFSYLVDRKIEKNYSSFSYLYYPKAFMRVTCHGGLFSHVDQSHVHVIALNGYIFVINWYD